MQTVKRELNGISIEAREVKNSQNKVNRRLDTTEKRSVNLKKSQKKPRRLNHTEGRAWP